jgi:5-formyltetrahydrofolate cyclo-ligase
MLKDDMKDEMRREMLDMRLGLSEQRVKRDSEAIVSRLLSLPCMQDAERVMAYSAVKNEPDIWELIHVLVAAGKNVALPCVTTEGIVAAEFRQGTQMQRGAYGISQPLRNPGCEPFEPQVVIVPGVVFDLQRCRIGFGAGYYDRFLQNSEAVKVGVCYESQLVDNIEADPHDVRMDYVVTERRVLGED